MAIKSAKWVGGNKWIVCSKYGSKGSNSVTPMKGGSQYSCGTGRAYIGTIMHELHQGLIARVGKERAHDWHKIAVV